MDDTYKLKGLRKKLIETVRSKGIRDERVLKIMTEIPRHFFVEPSLAEHSYEDKALQIGEEQTITQPFTVAYQTALLEIKPGDKVLEIGTGSGYQAAILVRLGARVYTIERNRTLYASAHKLLLELGYNVYAKCGDGSIGWKDFAPFDKILVTAGSPKIPESLIEQLKVGGRLVIPVGTSSVQEMKVIVRESETKTKEYTLEKFKFVPLIGKQAW